MSLISPIEKDHVSFGGVPGSQADQNHRSGIENHARDDEQSQTLSETQHSE